MNYDYSALTADPSKQDVKQYRLSCEVRGYDDEHGFDEQKAAPAERDLLSKGCVIVFAVCLGIGGVIAVPVAIVRLVSGDENVASRIAELVIGLIVLAVTFMLIRTVRSMTTHAIWLVRYRLSWFARANALTYVFRADPKQFPGITPAVKYYPYLDLDDVTLSNVLRTTIGPQIAVGHQYAWHHKYDTPGYSGSHGATSDHWNFLAINFGSSSPSFHLIHHRQQDAPDPLRSRFRFADGTAPEQVYAYFSRELAAAIAQLPDGYDVIVHNGWLYLLKSSLYDESTKAAGIEERFQIAEQLSPLVAELGRR